MFFRCKLSSVSYLCNCRAVCNVVGDYTTSWWDNVSLLPEASFGLRVLSLPACVRVSVNYVLVCAITRHKSGLQSPNLDQKMQNILLKVPNVCGTDWAWPSRSTFTLLKNSVYLSLLHLWNICEICLSNYSTSHMALHTLSDYYMPTDRVTS